MNDESSRRPSRQELLTEVEQLRARLAEAQDHLRAIRDGDVDAIVVSGRKGEQIFSLTGAEHVYRRVVETMKEGALTVGEEGRILFCNHQFSQLVKVPAQRIVGRLLTDFVPRNQRDRTTTMLRKCRSRSVKQRLVFQNAQGAAVPAHISAHVLDLPDGSCVCLVATDLTELEASTEMLQQLRRQQETLQASETRSKSLAENLPCVLMRYDRDLRVVYLSPLAAEITGVPVEAFLGKTNRQVGMPEALCELWEQAIQTVFRTGKNRDLEFDFPSPGGARTFCLKFAPEFGPGGTVDHVLGISTEITGRKRAEQALQEKEALLRSFFDSPGIMRGIVDVIEGDIFHVSCNTAAAAFYDSTPEAIGGKFASQLGLSPKELRVWLEHLDESRHTGQAITFEVSRRLANREMRLAATVSFLGLGPAGHPRFGFALLDVTERQRAEDQLRRANERLQRQTEELQTQSEELQARGQELQAANAELHEQEQTLRDRANELQMVVNAVPALIAYVDSRFHYRWVNRGYERWFGLPAREVEGRHARDVVGPAAWEIVRPHLERALAGEVVTYEERMPYRLGETRWAYVTCVPDRDEAGQVRGFIAQVTDVSQRKQAEEAVRRGGERSRLLSETASRLLAAENPQNVINDLCRQVMEHLGCHVFFNFLVDEKAGRLRLNACAGISEKETRAIEWLDLGVAVCGCFARDGRRIVAEEIPTTPDPRTDLVASYGVRAYACHPLTAAGKVIGTLSFGTRTRTRFSEDDLSLMQTVTDQVAVAIERVRAAQALAESEQRLRLALAGGGMGRGEWDLQDDSWSCCARSSELLGLDTPGQATAESFFRRIHPQDRDALEQHLTQARAEPSDFQAEFRVIRGRANVRGETLWLAAHSKVICAAQGRGVRMIGVLYDITPRKQMEEQLRRLNDRLEEEVRAQTEELRDAVDRLQDEVVRRVLAEGKLRKRSQMLEAFFQHTITPLAFLDKYFNFVRVNEASARAAGKDPEYFTGQNHFVLYPQAENRARFEQVVRTKLAHHAYAEPLSYLARSEQRATYWNWRLTPLLDDHGQVQFLVFNLEDVTDRQRAFQELEQRARQLQKLTLELSEAEDRERKRLAEVLHDDLQQQLAAAKFHLAILSSRLKSEPSLQEITGQLNQMMKDAIEKSRSLSHELSPAVLYQSDLGETFEWLARQIQAKHGLTFWTYVHIDGPCGGPGPGRYLLRGTQGLPL